MNNINNMREKSLYYIECICSKDVMFPNVEFHVGDVIYYNNNALSNEMYIFNKPHSYYVVEKDENVNRYKGLLTKSHLPFTRQKKNARKYKVLKRAEHIKAIIENRGDFKCEIREIKIIYTEKEL